MTVLGVWTGKEAEAFQKMMAPFEAETGIKIEFTGTRDLPAVLTTRVEAGNPPAAANALGLYQTKLLRSAEMNTPQNFPL
ncbi:unnamed protein product [marine sediment metagenome]|uniref:Uncharacterized protein n=1 Tax=marine sediment metagenome TaxID=412755 RepID=X1E2E3_9ZZZZ